MVIKRQQILRVNLKAKVAGFALRNRAHFLAAQRAVVAAARVGNQMIAGATFAVVGEKDHPALTVVREIASGLGGLDTGATDSGAGAAQFVFFTDAHAAAKLLTAPAAARTAAATDSRNGAEDNLSAALTPIFVPVVRCADEVTALSEALTKQLTAAGGTVVPDAPRAALTLISLRNGRQIGVATSHNFDFRQADAAGRLAWAKSHMTTTARLVQKLGDMRGEKILISLILEPKTATLALLLRERTGADVAVFAPANECDPAVAAALQDREIIVFTPQQTEIEDRAADIRAAQKAVSWKPHWLIDDGAHLVRLLHLAHPESLQQLRGVAEETTSGVTPLRGMAAAGALRVPVVAVNDAPTKTLFDNRVGTGESCILTIAYDLDRPLIDSEILVFGFGPVGFGVVRAARALGAKVTVVERDPLRALQAQTDGFHTAHTAQAVATADIVVSATGYRDTIGVAEILAAKSDAVFAVAGGVTDEINSAAALADGAVQQVESPYAGALTLRRVDTNTDVHILAFGHGVNYTSGEGNPIEVMDLSFATQAAALLQLRTELAEARPAVYELSAQAVRDIARVALNLDAETYSGSYTAPSREALTPWQNHRYREEEGACPR